MKDIIVSRGVKDLNSNVESGILYCFVIHMLFIFLIGQDPFQL